MNATEAKKLLEPIPQDEFITSLYTDEVGKCCAIGHLARLKSDDPNDYSKNNCFEKHESETYNFVRNKVRDFFSKNHPDAKCKESYNGVPNLASVNNSNDINGYNEKSIKDRVIHLLDDMIEAGY